MLLEIARVNRWGSGDPKSPDGAMFEILADCLGSYGHLPELSRCDPNRDGIAEGCYSACSSGGNTSPLTALMREENRHFMETPGLAYIECWMNDNNPSIGPVSRITEFWGRKLENFGLDGRSWEEWVFGYPGYLNTAHESRTVICTKRRDTGGQQLKEMRFGLCTALLGDGYFSWYTDEWHPQWHYLMGLEMGEPLSRWSTDGTIYTRQYSKAIVTVNPRTGTGEILR
jgi:hypothetical protein